MKISLQLLVLGLGWLVAAAMPAAADAYRHDRIVVMTPPDAPPLGTGRFTADQAAVTGVASLDHLCRELGVLAAEPFYPGILRRPGLARTADRIRVLRLAPEVDAAAVVARIAADPHLAAAELPTVPRLFYTPDDPLFAMQWYLAHIHAPEAWDHIRGDATRPAIIGIVDTGLALDQPEIAPNLWVNELEDLNQNGRRDAEDLDGVDQDGNGFIDDVVGWDFADNDGDPGEGVHHGTGVAVCASAATDNGVLVAGLGFSARLMALKAITDGGQLGEGYQPMLYAADNGAQVVNCSWGIPIYREFEEAIVAAVWAEDVVIVAAGGEGDVPTYPAAYEHVVAVSATDAADHHASFAPYGEYIDLCAPGVNILTIYGGEPTYVSGTSFASALVAGLAGLVRAWHPDFDAGQTVQLLADSAVPIDDLNPGFAGLLGAGRIDALSAVVTAVAPGAAPPPGPPFLRAHPNPSNAGTAVGFRLDVAGAVELAVFDTRGRRVAVLVAATLAAGPHSYTWQADAAPSGTYLLRLATDQGETTRKLTIVK